MKTKIITVLAVITFLILNLTPLAQAQSQGVSSKLKVYRVTTNVNGQEVVNQTTTTTPGDTLEYRLTYTNNLANGISDLQPVLPIPLGLQYISNTARPQINTASLNAGGDTFQSLPIQREETLASGDVVQREVPASEYRRLRWTVDSLGAKQSVTLTARVLVIDSNAIGQ